MKPTLSFYGRPELKADLQRRLAEHHRLDAIVQGTFADFRDHHRGCAVGCVIRDLADSRRCITPHAEAEELTGVPEVIWHLVDSIFEGLAAKDAPAFAVAILDVVPVGVDLSGVWPAFARWLLVDPEHGVVRFADSDQCREAIERVAALFARADASPEEWAAARAASAANAAWTAARDAWTAASAASAASAARAARDAGSAAARDAATAANAANAASAANAARDAQASALIRILQEAGK